MAEGSVPPTSSVSDTLDTLESAGGVIDGLRAIGSHPQSSISGRARVAKVVASDRDGLPGLAELLDSVEPGEVLVIGWEADLIASTFGGLAARRTAERGARAVVIDGYARDVDEIVASGLPVWARGTTPRTGRGRLKVVAAESGVDIAGVRVRPGDTVVADLTGICVIKEERSQDVLRGASERAKLDEAFEVRLASGDTFRSAQDSTGAV